jgi:hypothetical protein
MQIKPGQIWRHYKGGVYEIVGVAIHSETLEEMVIYKSLYDGDKYKKGTIWVRPKLMWFEKVEWKRKKVKRFTQIFS